MKRNAIALSRRHRAWLYSTTAFLFITGAVWALLHYGFPVRDDFGSTANPAEPWLLKAHGAAAMLILFLLGTLYPLHIRRAWHASKNRPSGGFLFTICGLLAVTGYGLYYAGGESLRTWTSWLHLAIGLLLPLIIAIHAWCGRRSR